MAKAVNPVLRTYFPHPDGSLRSYPVQQVTTAPDNSTEGLALKTNFGAGTYLYNNGNWGDGCFYKIGGVDASTGFDFTNPDVSPGIYGVAQHTAFQLLHPSGSSYPIPNGGVGVRDVSTQYYDFRFENVTGPAGTGITTACYQERKLPYADPAQIGFTMYPVNGAQGMYYWRFWHRYKTGFAAAREAGGTWFNTVTGSKTADVFSGRGANRPHQVIMDNARNMTFFADSERSAASSNRIYIRSASQPATPSTGTTNVPGGWYDRQSDVPAGAGSVWMSAGTRPNGTGNWTWQTPQAAASEDGVTDTYRGRAWDEWERHPINGSLTEYTIGQAPEDQWILFEFAFRPSNSDAVGWAWAAINGVQVLAVSGKNVPDTRSEIIERLGVFNYYINGSQSGDARMGYWTTGLEVWNRFPAHAAPHPAWS